MKLAGLLLSLLAVLMGCKQSPYSQSAASSKAPTRRTTSSTLDPGTSPNGWRLHEEVNKMDGVKQIGLVKEGKDKGSLLIRCIGRKTDVYVSTDEIVENGMVRIKLDDGPPVRQTWGRSGSMDALFAPNGAALAHELPKHQTFLVELSPLHRTPEVLEFDLDGLDQKISSIAEACDWAAADRALEKARHEADRLNNALAELRRSISPNVKECTLGWCWYDPDDPNWRKGSAPHAKREYALDDALEKAQANMAFKAQKAAVEKKYSLQIPLPDYR